MVDNSPWVPRPTYGRDLIAAIPAELRERPIVCTQPEPWALAGGHFDAARTQLHMVHTMDRDVALAEADGFDSASAVIGIGGGMALDHAKLTAWRRELPLVLVPAILSVDAGFTRQVGVRVGSRVRYIGDARADHLLIDFELLRKAPPLLNRAGVGDVLSIATARWDWRQAAEREGESYDPAVAAEANALLDRLYAGAPAIRDVSDEGLQLLSELFVAEVALCERWGSSRPEEGSEHYLAYALEAASGGHFVHGQLIALCVVLVAALQGQDTDPIVSFLDRVGLDWSPSAVGTTRNALGEALRGMKRYLAHETQLLPGVFHFMDGLAAAEAAWLLDSAERLHR